MSGVGRHEGAEYRGLALAQQLLDAWQRIPRCQYGRNRLAELELLTVLWNVGQVWHRRTGPKARVTCIDDRFARTRSERLW